jgi:quercetin dioxygenase-like cupin family protein
MHVLTPNRTENIELPSVDRSRRPMLGVSARGKRRAMSIKAEEHDTGITRNGSRSSGKGPRGVFYWRRPRRPGVRSAGPARAPAAHITFEPGVRTAWRTNPLGQTLVVTSGLGWVQREGGPVEEIRPGDVVWFSPGEKHWHGASATNAMCHIAIQEALNGNTVEWMEKVADVQYRQKSQTGE